MKNLDYYMSLPYEMKLEELSDDDGGGIFCLSHSWEKWP